MGKPERKTRERTCSSSSSYFLRCFGISWKIHSDKPILDAVQETQKMKMKMKKKTRTRWFSRPPNFRLKNGEITTAPIYETEKQNLIVEDDKQNLFRVIRHVTDPKNTATSGFKSVEHASNEKDTNGQRDINPDPLSFLGYDTCHERVSTTVRGGKLDPTKTIGSGSKPKELRKKSSRVRKGSRVGSFDPIIGISVIMLTLIIMLIWGRLCAILCTSTWCYFLPRLKEAATAVAKAKRKRSGSNEAEDGSFPGDLDFNSEAYKKKVILEGFLFRQHHVSL